MCWTIRDLLVVQKISLLEIISTCSAASYVVVDPSGVFHAVDSSYTSSYPQVHTCSLWNASCTSCTSNSMLLLSQGQRLEDPRLDVPSPVLLDDLV